MNSYPYQAVEREIRVIYLPFKSSVQILRSLNTRKVCKWKLCMVALYFSLLLTLGGKVLRGVLCRHVYVDRNTVLHTLLCKGVAAQGLHIVIK